MTRISFLMPTFNRAHLIEESIISVTSQMSADDELILIDDGSDDDTPEVLKRVAGDHRIIRQENSGKAVALNRGLSEAQGKFIWICDDDDVLREGCVRLMVAAINKPNTDMVFARYSRFNEVDGERQDMGTGYWPDLSSGSIARHVLEDSFVMQNATLATREAYATVGSFDEKLLRSLDYDMAVRLATQVRCRYVDFIAFDQRKHDGARGPASIRHAAGSSETVWLDYDRRIFERQRQIIPLSFYQSMFTHTDPRLRKRAALLQRACVSARHDMWSDAVMDLRAASALAPTVALGSVERDICRRSVCGKHGFPGALDDEIIAQLRALEGEGGNATEIVETVLRGILWRLRDDDKTMRQSAKDLIRSVIGLSGLARLSASHLVSRMGSESDNGIVENRMIEPLIVANQQDKKIDSLADAGPPGH
ncbi:glycosyltransferase family 2 protein [Erythrobacter sp. HA6-11]